MISADELTTKSLAEIEALYQSAPVGPLPRGLFLGRTLHYLPRGPVAHALDFALFDALPYGLDFETCHWWFARPGWQAGRFGFREGPSAWRATRTLQLTYDHSRLPARVRALLYDEVKPLGDDLCLGLGGVRGDAGTGDHFFFLLRR